MTATLKEKSMSPDSRYGKLVEYSVVYDSPHIQLELDRVHHTDSAETLEPSQIPHTASFAPCITDFMSSMFTYPASV